MAATSRNPALLLGDVNAEADDLLSTAFYESPDYRTLIEHPSGRVVVGRRGTGKSALAWKLGETWAADGKTHVVPLLPTEDQMIALRGLAQSLTVEYALTRAFFRIAWKAALALEALSKLVSHYKFKALPQHGFAEPCVKSWSQGGDTVNERMDSLLRPIIEEHGDAATTIGRLQKDLQWSQIEDALRACLGATGTKIAIIIDRVDEGYQPDDSGIGIVAGLASAAIDLSNNFDSLYATLFLRDNMARAIAAHDSDYSRSIESRVLRLHWDARALIDMASERIKAALHLQVQSSKAIWNRFVLDELRDIAGFRRCLRFTLYRPRDVLLLLNQAFYHCHKRNGTRISLNDLEATAKTISSNRLSDLFREYESVAPEIERLVRALGGGSAYYSRERIVGQLEAVLSSDEADPLTQQGLRLIENASAAIRVLYEFGVIGVQDSTSADFAFCHDGHEIIQDIGKATNFLVHPCYWMALDLDEQPLDQADAETVYDEYEITVVSKTPQERAARITRIANEVKTIPCGREGASSFETWCHRALSTAFAGHLRNLELKPNSQASNRRDIVGRNAGEAGVWRHLSEDYGVRQVVFEVKNYAEPTVDDFRQMRDYLHDHYGRCGFIICRAQSSEITGPILNRVREQWANHRLLNVLIDERFLRRVLEKIRSPAKHNAANRDLEKLVDAYERLYVSGQMSPKNRKKAR